MQEYLFLLDEFDRMLKRESNERERYGREFDHRFAAFDSRISRWLTVVFTFISVAITALFIRDRLRAINYTFL